MNILTAESISKSYGVKVLFKDISFGIDDGEKIGIIGVNGTGKSTLLKILAGLEPSEKGQIVKGNSVQVQYLPQNPEFYEDATVLQQVFKGNSPEMQLVRDYELALNKLERDPSNAAYQNSLLKLGGRMDELNAWQLESEAKTILTKLGITEFEMPLKSLSGGQKKRVALASALINPADLLILDEPTNHIDNETVDWLEQYLNKRKGALVMITHDRYFLDRVVNRIFELDRGDLYPYPGNYTRYLELKAERDEQEEASERKRQNRLRNELAWIQRGAKARTTKQKARIERFERLKDDKPLEKLGKVELSAAATRLGKKVIECTGLHKRYPERGVVIEDFSMIIGRYERIGIIGPNGQGKSTLINILAGRDKADQGQVEWGPTVNIGYFAQENTELNPEQRVIEVIKEVAEVIHTPDGGTITASQMLERFLFTPSQQWTPVGLLSGGEKRRLYLLRVLMASPNVLFLDEPTNDLDIHTLSVLEEYLDGYPGTVIAVSHDRYFLDRVAEKILAFEGEGHIHLTIGNYSDYKEQTESLEPVNGKDSNNKANRLNTSFSKTSTGNNKDKAKPLKMTYKEQREFEQIDNFIAEVEEALQKTNAEMFQAGSNYGKLNELTKVKEEQEGKLEELLERWTYLNELAEKIAQSKGDN